jgi:hypothetical protein
MKAVRLTGTITIEPSEVAMPRTGQNKGIIGLISGRKCREDSGEALFNL